MKRRYMVIGFILIAVLGVGYFAWQLQASERSPDVTIYDTPAMVESISLTAADEKNPSPTFHVTYLDGETKQMTPEQYALLLLQKDDSRTFTFRLLNISSSVGVAWVILGLLGQVLFTGRMVVQWLVSEKKQQSVVPTSFWWLSLIGASMLITYFIWRKDIVGFLGQGAGWLIYGRNLWMIYHPRAIKDA